MYKRSEFQLIKTRIFESRRFIQVISGPRQVGKTTLVQQVLEEYPHGKHYISADGMAGAGHRWLSEQWEVARIMCREGGWHEFVLAIDEVQKIGNWSEAVKREWDFDSYHKIPVKVILSGSSRLLLKQGLTESLAGRYESIYIGHWTLSEMEAAFGWTPQQYCWFGGFPGSASLVSDETRWKKYIGESIIETSISRDILMLTRIDKPALMRRLFELGCLYSGQILSFTKILGQLLDAGNTTTLSAYLHYLDQAGLLTGIEKFTSGRIRQRSSSPKFQVHNMALLSAQSELIYSQALNQPDRWGRIVESAVGAYLVNRSLVEDFRLFYWRDRNDEVDFVIEKGGMVIGLEIKAGTLRGKGGLTSFHRKVQPHKVLVIGDQGLPWQDFLKMSPSGLF